MERVYNFSAGPSMMPVEILQQAKEDLISYPGAGCSVMEMSHRSAAFEKIIADAESSLRRLMHIPDDYAVLFLQGGASMQFSAVPMNLARQGQTTNYAVTGQFAGKALAEGERWGKAVAVTSSKADTFSYIPKITPELLSPDAAYLHITGNNTIFGTCYNTLPENMTAANFGKISEFATKEDLALGLINMIFETIGMMAVFNSRMHRTRDIVLTGNLTQIAQAKGTFKTLSDMFDVNFIIPERAQYATVIGAALCTL